MVTAGVKESFPVCTCPGRLLGGQKGRRHHLRLSVDRPHWASLEAQAVKSPPGVPETRVPSLGREDPLEEAWQPTPVFLPGESHGQRGLMGYSPRGRKESDRPEALSTHTRTYLLALQSRVHLCCTTSWTSCVYTYTSSFVGIALATCTPRLNSGVLHSSSRMHALFSNVYFCLILT